MVPALEMNGRLVGYNKDNQNGKLSFPPGVTPTATYGAMRGAFDLRTRPWSDTEPHAGFIRPQQQGT